MRWSRRACPSRISERRSSMRFPVCACPSSISERRSSMRFPVCAYPSSISERRSSYRLPASRLTSRKRPIINAANATNPLINVESMSASQVGPGQISIRPATPGRDLLPVTIQARRMPLPWHKAGARIGNRRVPEEAAATPRGRGPNAVSRAVDSGRGPRRMTTAVAAPDRRSACRSQACASRSRSAAALRAPRVSEGAASVTLAESDPRAPHAAPAVQERSGPHRSWCAEPPAFHHPHRRSARSCFQPGGAAIGGRTRRRASAARMHRCFQPGGAAIGGPGLASNGAPVYDSRRTGGPPVEPRGGRRRGSR